MRKTLVRTGAALAIAAGILGMTGGIASADELSAPVVVPSNPTGADYVNGWNQAGALAIGGAAGLVSSAWAGAIPSIIQGASNSLG
jgi:hypothetical protein